MFKRYLEIVRVYIEGLSRQSSERIISETASCIPRGPRLMLSGGQMIMSEFLI